MIVVMKPGAPRKDTGTVIGKIRELGYPPHTIYGKTRNVIGAIGDERGKFVLHSLESLPGVERVVPILKPYKLASAEGNCQPPASPRRVPGAGGTGAEDPAQGRGRGGDACRDRGDEPDGRRPGRPVLRHPAGGSPQRPELLPPEADRKIEAADPPQAGDDDDHHRVPHERRILPLRGEPPGDPLRARDPHVRGRDPEYARPLGGPRAEGADPPADHRRPLPRNRALPVREADVVRLGGSGRGRADDRGPPHPGEGPFRRPPVADLREIRGADGGLEALRRRGRQDDLSKPSRLAHMTSFFRPRTLVAALAGLFLLHLGYLYVKVGAGLARDAWEVPSILYGRPAIIRPGDLVGNLQLPERLGRPFLRHR